MSEETYGTQGGGGQEDGTSPASPQPASPEPGSQPARQEPQGNEPITRKELLEVVEQIKREAQSMTDKMGSRLDKKIESAIIEANATIKLNEESGIQMTEQQKEALRNKKIDAAIHSSPQPSGQEAQPAPAGEPGSQQQANQPINLAQEVNRIMAETGVYISAQEANELIGPVKTPFEYLKAFESLAEQRQLNHQPSGPNPRVPSQVVGTRIGGSQTALRQQYDAEIAQIAAGTHPTIRRGQTLALSQMQQQYRQKGLDI